MLALVVDHAGWPVAVALTAILLASVYAALARGLIADGISPIVAVYVALTAVAIGCIHFLIRPHIITLAFVYVTLRLCQKQHERGGWIVAWVPVLTAVLANLHGGFLALPGIVATAAVAHAVAGPWDGLGRREVARFGLAFVACCLAGLINPYGWNLYRHVGNLLVTSGVTTLIEEYQPAPFGKPEARVLEMTVLTPMALPVLVEPAGRPLPARAHAGLAPLSLTSIPMPPCSPSRRRATGQPPRGLPISFRSFWSRPEAPVDLDSRHGRRLALHWPRRGSNWAGSTRPSGLSRSATLNRQPTASHLFNEQDWGGLIESECYPAGPRSWTTGSSSSARRPSSSTSRPWPAARPGRRSATGTTSAWSGSSPTGAWQTDGRGAGMEGALPGQDLGAIRT